MNDLLVSSSAPRTFVSSCPFPEKFLVCTDTIVSTGLRNLAPDSVSVIVSRFTSFH